MENFDNWFVVGAFGVALVLMLVLLVQRLYQNPLLQKDYGDNRESEIEGYDPDAGELSEGDSGVSDNPELGNLGSDNLRDDDYDEKR